MKILLDVDTGVDNFTILLYVLFNPEIEIVGISTVCGNIKAWLAAEDTMKTPDLAGAPDIPVAVRAKKPSCREWDGRVALIHGKNGLGSMELPPSRRNARDVDVSRFHMDLTKQYKRELVVVTLSPLTNIARAIGEYPGLVHRIEGLMMVGGTLTVHGGVPPVTEASMACDPQTCDQVFTLGMDITVVGLNVTMKTRLRMEHLDWLSGRYRPTCRSAVDYMKQTIIHHLRGNQTQNYYMDNCPLHDPPAVMCAVMPSLVRTESRKAGVECGGTYCRGMIVTDLREHPFQAGYARLAVEVDSERAVRELTSIFWE